MVATIWTWGGWSALTAVGTLVAVVVALYLGPLRDRRSHPVLQLRPRVVQVLNRDTRAPSCGIARGRDSPRRTGRNTASAVEVLVQSVSVDDQLVPLVIGPLVWSQSRTSQIDIGPGSTFDVNLLRVTRMGVEGEKRAAIGYAGPNQDAGFFLPSQAELDQLPAGRYEFTLSVRAWNLDACVWTVRATFDGVWGVDVDDVHQHLIVEQPVRAR